MEYGGVLCETKGVEQRLKAGMSMVWIGDNPESVWLRGCGGALNAEQESRRCRDGVRVAQGLLAPSKESGDRAGLGLDGGDLSSGFSVKTQGILLSGFEEER